MKHFLTTIGLFILFQINTKLIAQDSLRLILPVGHSSTINSIFNTPDLKYIITTSDDNTAKLWETKSGKLIKTFSNHSARINGIDFDTTSNLFITYSDDKNICLWDLKRDYPLKIFKGINGKITSAKLNINKNCIISTDENGHILIWTIATGKIKKNINAHADRIYDFILNEKKNKAISISSDGYFKIWDTKQWICLKKQKHGSTFPTFSKKFDNHSSLFLTSNDSTIIEYDLKKNTILRRIIANKGWITSFDVSKSGHYLVTTGIDSVVMLFDLFDNSKCLLRYKMSHWGLSLSINQFENSFVVGTQDGSYYEFDIINKKLLYQSKSEISGSVEKVSYLNGTNFFAIGSKNGDCLVIESVSGSIKNRLTNKMSEIKSIQSFYENPIIIISNKKPTIYNYKNSTFNFLKLNDEFGKDYEVIKSKISDQYIYYNLDKLIVNNFQNYKLVFRGSKIYKAGYNNSESNYFVMINETKTRINKIKLYDSQNGILSDSLILDDGYFSFSSICFSNNDSLIYLGTSDGNIIGYDIKQTKIIFNKNVSEEYINYISLDSSNQNMIAISDNEIIHLKLNSDSLCREKSDFYIMSANSFGFNNGIIVGKISGGVDIISNDKKMKPNYIKADYPITAISPLFLISKIAIGFLNGVSEIWDITKKKKELVIYLLDSMDYILKLPNSPYYMCSKNASKMLHYVTPSLKVIGFNQLDPIYNRPDIVLDSIGKYFAGGSDLKLIQQYKEVWVKRMIRLGLDTATASNQIEVPDAEIVNADNIEYNNSSGKINFHFKAYDPKHKLIRYNVYVNEVPVYESNGISITGRVNQFEKDISLNLTQGDNKIQVSVMNELGLENYRYPVFVQYHPKDSILSNIYYIGIGVDSFSTSNFNLQYCVKDVNDLRDYFSKENNTKTIILKNKEVTKENVLKIKEILKQTTEQDKVIISCSSHGLLDKNNNFYLAMTDVDFNQPELRGLAYEDLQGLLDGIPARKKLLLLDACNSGENEKSENKETAKSKKIDIKEGSKGIEIETVSDSYNTKNSFETMMELFVNVNNQTGATIISAAGGKQSAFEGKAVLVNGKPISNGAFTYSIIEYLTQNKNNKNKLTVNQLKQYVEQRVSEITEGKQKPTSRQETMEVDWRL
jgi:WD40 repeat protein